MWDITNIRNEILTAFLTRLSFSPPPSLPPPPAPLSVDGNSVLISVKVQARTHERQGFMSMHNAL